VEMNAPNVQLLRTLAWTYAVVLIVFTDVLVGMYAWRNACGWRVRPSARAYRSSTRRASRGVSTRPLRLRDTVRAGNDRAQRSCRTFILREMPMTAYLISLALAGIVAIAVWGAFE